MERRGSLDGTTPPHRATILDVAAAAGVSQATASKALNGRGRMTAETRERVRSAAERLGFRPNAMARALVHKRSFTLGLITDDTYGRFTLPVAAGLSAAMADRGVSVFLCAIDGDPALARRSVEAMEEKRVDGLIVAGKRIDRALPIAPTPHLPTVYVNAACPPGAVGFVPDDEGGARLATAHLIAAGRRRIAHVTGPRAFAAVGLRERGWRLALSEAGLAPWGDALAGEWSEDFGYRACEGVFAARGTALPDAVLCGNDQIARGLIDGLTAHGLRVPDDVAVVGYDNWEVFAQAARPPLTSVDMELKDLGRRAGSALLDTIDGTPAEPGVRRLACRLVVRRSCGTADRPRRAEGGETAHTEAAGGSIE